MRNSVTLLLITTASVGACIPYRASIRQARVGTVVDDKSGHPVADAKVLVESWQVLIPSGRKFARKDAFQVITDRNGRFEVPKKTEWFLVILLPHMGPTFAERFCVTRTGYAPLLGDPWMSPRDLSWRYTFPNPFRLKQGDHSRGEGSDCLFPSGD